MKNTELEVNQNKLLEVNNLSKIFKTNSRDNFFNKIDNIAVNNISFDISSGETIGVVGESGCGKSTLAKLIVNLLTPTNGSIFYKGTDIQSIVGNDLKKLRKNIQIIFQDPYSTLNPRLKIGKAISEPLSVHNIVERSQIKKYLYPFTGTSRLERKTLRAVSQFIFRRTKTKNQYCQVTLSQTRIINCG